MIELEKNYQLEWLQKRHVAHSLWNCCQVLTKIKEFKSFEEIYKEKNNPVIEEEKTAEEIMGEVYLKFKGGIEDESV